MTAPGRPPNHWLVAIAVVVPTFMVVLDTTIANVALRYIAGGLSAAEVDAEWVITSYLAANAVVAFMLSRGIDARWLVVVGLSLMAAGNYWLSQMNLEIGPWDVAWPRVVTIAGRALLVTPLNVSVYQNVPLHMRGAAVGLFSLMRNEGGSVGMSVAQTVRERREQFHLLRLNEYLDPLNANLCDSLAGLRSALGPATGDAATADAMSHPMFDNLRQQPTLSLAYFDVVWLSAVVAVALIALALLMRRSVAEKGAHLASE